MYPEKKIDVKAPHVVGLWGMRERAIHDEMNTSIKLMIEIQSSGASYIDEERAHDDIINDVNAHLPC